MKLKIIIDILFIFFALPCALKIETKNEMNKSYDFIYNNIADGLETAAHRWILHKARVY